jgi:hypothetical protein
LIVPTAGLATNAFPEGSNAGGDWPEHAGSVKFPGRTAFSVLKDKPVTNADAENPTTGVVIVLLHVPVPGPKVTNRPPGTVRLPSLASVAVKSTASALVSVAVNVAVPVLSVTAVLPGLAEPAGVITA